MKLKIRLHVDEVNDLTFDNVEIGPDGATIANGDIFVTIAPAESKKPKVSQTQRTAPAQRNNGGN